MLTEWWAIQERQDGFTGRAWPSMFLVDVTQSQVRVSNSALYTFISVRWYVSGYCHEIMIMSMTVIAQTRAGR